MSKIIDGKKIQKKIKEQLIQKINLFSQKPNLAIIYIGSDKGSEQYVRMKKHFGNSLGVSVHVFHFLTSTTKDIIDLIQKISPLYTGVMVQFPLPENIDAKQVLDSIPEEKDVDVLKKEKLVLDNLVLYPPVVRAVECMLKHASINLENYKGVVTVVGFGKTVGVPMLNFLHDKKIKNYSVKKNTSEKERAKIFKSSNVIISGVGSAGIISGDMIPEGAVCIDVGFSLDTSGKTVGDFSIDAYAKSSFFTPVPGGVGPVGIAFLFENLYELHCIFNKSE